MKKTIITIAVIAVIGFGIYYIASKPAPAPVIPVSNNPTASTTENIPITIKNFSFNPPTLTVKTGTKVTWVNNDSVTHTVTAYKNGPLDAAALSPGESFSFVFNTPRSVKYLCTIHPTMEGEVIIEN